MENQLRINIIRLLVMAAVVLVLWVLINLVAWAMYKQACAGASLHEYVRMACWEVD